MTQRQIARQGPPRPVPLPKAAPRQDLQTRTTIRWMATSGPPSRLSGNGAISLAFAAYLLEQPRLQAGQSTPTRSGLGVTASGLASRSRAETDYQWDAGKPMIAENYASILYDLAQASAPSRPYGCLLRTVAWRVLEYVNMMDPHMRG